MKFIAKMILVILIVPLFLIGILAAVVKFQLLNPVFWEDTLSKYNVYSTLTSVIKQSIEEQTIKEGGSKSAVKILTDLVTVENTKDVVDRNIENILNYANLKAPELLVYVPISKFPKNLLPVNFANLPEQLPLTDLLTKLNITGITDTQIQYISLFGKTATYVLILDISLLVLFIILLFILENAGSRFIAPGIVFVIGGLLLIGLYTGGNQLRIQLATGLGQKSSTAASILSAVAPPLITEILKVWTIAGAAAILIGILLFFLKKPGKLPL